MSIRPQKELAAKVLKVGVSRVWVDPERIEDIELAIRREDIRKLIHEGVIKVKPKVGVSRGRFRVRRLKKKKGQRIGAGSRKGKKGAHISRKTIWMNTIRRIRKELKSLRAKRLITAHTYRMLYLRAKGGVFKTVAQLRNFIEQNKLYRR
ncbi:MAG: 50S ribosomal protein L19e [Candidatus Odinarchaeia archaeon]